MTEKRFIVLLSIIFAGIYTQAGAAIDVAGYESFQIGKASGGDHIITYKGSAAEFRGWAISPDGNITKYEWDFDGDGRVDFSSERTGNAIHTFTKAGRYVAAFRAYCDDGKELPSYEVRVIVREGFGGTEYVPRKYSCMSDSAELEEEKNLLIERLKIQPDERQFLQMPQLQRCDRIWPLSALGDGCCEVDRRP